MNLVCKIRIADDGAGNQLREESNVQHDIPQAFLCRFPAVHIDHIGNCLKRKEGNADWQCNLRNRKPHKRQAVQVFRKESKIFKYEEYSQIHTDRYKQETLPGIFADASILQAKIQLDTMTSSMTNTKRGSPHA